jgi:hypothetical protein
MYVFANWLKGDIVPLWLGLVIIAVLGLIVGTLTTLFNQWLNNKIK